MNCLTLFGLALAPLYSSLAKVESDRGATSDNVYQIRVLYVEDVNRISGRKYTARDVLDKDKSEMMMYLYWEHYGNAYTRETGRAVTYEVLARIHNGGPRGWQKPSTVKYWRKVVKEMKSMGVAVK